MHDPYADVKWQDVIRVASATHMHLGNQKQLENAYEFGIRHFPISNYYPSVPYDADTRLSDFRLRQSWPATRDGHRVEPPINWNEIIDWQGDLEEPYRSQLPFVETDRAYTSIPPDAILSHNAEHHGFSNSQAHICSPGSSFCSGTFDARSHFQLNQHGFPVGFGGTWQEAFEGMIDALDYPEGGGITINHPTWFSKFTDEQVFQMLDFDDRVLGIEIYNDYSFKKDWQQNPEYTVPDEPEQGFSLQLWDRILLTGRRCWGFCVPDHSAGSGDWGGRSLLVVGDQIERECLKAYRDGSFYGCLTGRGPYVESFEASPTSIDIALTEPAEIRFIADAQVAATVTGDRATFAVPQKAGAPDVVYARVEVQHVSGERLFLQPVRYGARAS
ncbi:MAG: hypothetical protein HOB49_03480 [Gemmatimonadetes bacterium]|nr:hypothetical protein [Gemmatimonadota bacterium]MBT6626040.1 hypothetical protein [Gemmatimonadota bacterium]